MDIPTEQAEPTIQAEDVRSRAAADALLKAAGSGRDLALIHI